MPMLKVDGWVAGWNDSKSAGRITVWSGGGRQPSIDTNNVALFGAFVTMLSSGTALFDPQGRVLAAGSRLPVSDAVEFSEGGGDAPFPW